ncbi:CUE domain-containing protein 2 isoform X1 [Biomphalaria pfeifferi]|uniref:CUE domain-containing protein 2 isoform X1 n=1 Tax=Biomphalaria pfeifferi TaxID=112525 RepID=A0AAD8BFK0_BIOPF|nr:CUE domain-containing protein 2 isoform X1 [Biomphalaria pfeifferi]
METKVHNELSAFLACHSLEDSIRNIDEIVLTYFVGVVELVIQGDEGLDLDDVMDMMNAYLPGFDLIGREKVIDWMFGLAGRLLTSEKEKSEFKEDAYAEKTMLPVEDTRTNCIASVGKETDTDGDKKFPSYEYSKDSKCIDLNMGVFKSSFGCSSPPHNINTSIHSKNLEDGVNCCEPNTQSGTLVSSPLSMSLFPPLSSSPTEKLSHSKRKGRQLSCSSQESTDEKPEQLSTEEESCVQTLLEMFPGACTMEARHCLKLSAGDMDRAAQLIMDRQETGQAITDRKAPTSRSHKFKKVIDYKLDDDSIKSGVLKKYSFVDTEEDKKTFRPQPPKGEAKKLVRYRDGQVVSMKGEKFSEISKKESDEVKSTYVNLKPARKYRFH